MRWPGLIFAITMLLTSCTPLPDEPLRLGTNIWIGYEPLYLARAQGQLQPDSVKLVEYVSATQTMLGIIDGAVDAAAVTLDEALLLQQQGIDIRIVLVMDYSAGADALLARPEIDTLAGLRGRRIGYEATALGAYLMHRSLTLAELKPSDVTLVSLELSRHEQAYLDGAIDALITFDPVRSHLLAKGANTLLDTRALPGEVVDVLVVRNDQLPRHQEHLRVLLAHWFSAIDYIQSDPAAAARLMNARMKLGEGALLAALEGVKFPSRSENQRLLIGTPGALQLQAQRLATIMMEERLLHSPVAVPPLFERPLLQALYPQ